LKVCIILKKQPQIPYQLVHSSRDLPATDPIDWMYHSVKSLLQQSMVAFLPIAEPFQHSIVPDAIPAFLFMVS